ncbi:PTS mannose transporter subunit IID [Clostridium novyi B str. ATCC 27606]|uniref:PTS mannose transporter subunit IID n=2 Tax=Clostridium TaxID=1485 RepID=A0AA40ISN6_CLONO|nr:MULTISPECIES: PTS sugar transporter subunit IIA [Clostridium]KEI13252.1 PTS mannose transporter subunit IID [Clostridium novyi B str. ATCC 27606]KEI13802.1 PTS mannose transporter subunit IID [Clostridium novyi B str. NCTC 9691]KEI16512.1 PTS mannose transporter subunit IID [Clostridium haemolyticum NCTC 9693]KGN04358.1 PTS mannose transporter subunit IID [Clostridium haemolyticum NCTC 8350]OOB75795.1 PTS mannose transporter subunit IID [Clostridium haemolyticum]
MIALIIATHGDFSQEIVKSSEMIFGKQENLGVVTFKTGEGVEDLINKYHKVIKNLDIEDGVLFLVDLFGGSPFNAASRIMIENKNMDIIAGVNLPMLLEVYGSRSSSSLEGLVDIAKNSAIQGVKSFRSIIKSNEEDDL